MGRFVLDGVLEAGMSDLKGVEALRGLAAIGIATYSWLWAIGVTTTPPAANLYLLYDLYFVISGFVISQIYRARLTSVREASRFVLLRFARVYPLHVAVLLVLLAFQTAGGSGYAIGSLAEFLANLAMLQGFGVIDPAAWNAPAWFISAEFGVSILFALLCLADIPRSASGLGALALCVLLALWLLGGRPEGLQSDGAGMLLRGFAGFMLGVLTQAVRRADWVGRWRREQSALSSTTWEVAALSAAIGFIAVSPPVTHAVAPPIFAALVFILSATGGVIRKLLDRGPAQALARISFGVFMCHWLLAGAVRNIAAAPRIASLSIDALGPAEAAALATPLYLLAVIALAVVAERWVERPTRDAMRAWIDRRNRGYAARARRRSNVV